MFFTPEGITGPVPEMHGKRFAWAAIFDRIPSSSDNAEPVKLMGPASERLIEKCRESPGLRVWAGFKR